MNLLGLLKDNLTPEVISQAANLIGEDKDKTSSALGGILPAIMGGVMSKASNEEGASGLLSMLKDGGHDGGMLGNIAGMLGGGDSTSSMMSAGSGIVSSLFGDKVGGLVSLLSGFAGVKDSSITSLLGMAAPMVMGMLGKQVSSQGLGASGLMDLLSSQKDHVAAAMPAGLGDKLGGLLGMGSMFGGASGLASAAMGAVTGSVSDAASTAKSAATAAASKVEDVVEDAAGGGMGFLKWLLPLLFVGGIALYFMKGCGNKVADVGAMADSTMKPAGDVVVAGADSLSATAGEVVEGAKKMFDISLPDGTKLNVPEGSLEDQMVKYVMDDKAAIDKAKWFNFDRLLFDIGKATLKAESQEQVDKTAAILKAFPKVKIKIGGYTDNVGKAASNMKLSAERANTVMAALVAAGIDKGRLEAEGYGAEHPAASNDTEEGRAANRRIAVSVREK
jgi:OmpA-OmpF porin, OOP family